MQPIIADSARKRGYSDGDMLHVWNNPVLVEAEDEGYTTFVGPDTAGRIMEIGVVEGDIATVIVHSMRPARRKYTQRLSKGR